MNRHELIFRNGKFGSEHPSLKAMVQPRWQVTLQRLRFGVHVVDQFAVTRLNAAPSDFEGMRHGAIGSGKFFRDDEHAFQPLESSKVCVRVFDDAFVKRLHLGVGDKFLGEPKLILLTRAQSSRAGSVARSGPRGTCACRQG